MLKNQSYKRSKVALHKYCLTEILFVISLKKKITHKCLRYFKGSKSLWNKKNQYIFSLTDLRNKGKLYLDIAF